MSRRNVVRVVSMSGEAYGRCVRLHYSPQGCQDFCSVADFQLMVYLLRNAFAMVNLYVNVQSTTYSRAQHPHLVGAW